MYFYFVNWDENNSAEVDTFVFETMNLDYDKIPGCASQLVFLSVLTSIILSLLIL